MKILPLGRMAYYITHLWKWNLSEAIYSVVDRDVCHFSQFTMEGFGECWINLKMTEGKHLYIESCGLIKYL